MCARIQSPPHRPATGLPVGSAGGALGQRPVGAAAGGHIGGCHEHVVHVHLQRGAVTYRRQVMPRRAVAFRICAVIKTIDPTGRRKGRIRIARNIRERNTHAVVGADLKIQRPQVSIGGGYIPRVATDHGSVASIGFRLVGSLYRELCGGYRLGIDARGQAVGRRSKHGRVGTGVLNAKPVGVAALRNRVKRDTSPISETGPPALRPGRQTVAVAGNVRRGAIKIPIQSCMRNIRVGRTRLEPPISHSSGVNGRRVQ